MEEKKTKKSHFDEQAKWNKRNEELTKSPITAEEDDVPSSQSLADFLNM